MWLGDGFAFHGGFIMIELSPDLEESQTMLRSNTNNFGRRVCEMPESEGWKRRRGKERGAIMEELIKETESGLITSISHLFDFSTLQ